MSEKLDKSKEDREKAREKRKKEREERKKIREEKKKVKLKQIKKDLEEAVVEVSSPTPSQKNEDSKTEIILDAPNATQNWANQVEVGEVVSSSPIITSTTLEGTLGGSEFVKKEKKKNDDMKYSEPRREENDDRNYSTSQVSYVQSGEKVDLLEIGKHDSQYGEASFAKEARLTEAAGFESENNMKYSAGTSGKFDFDKRKSIHDLVTEGRGISKMDKNYQE